MPAMQFVMYGTILAILLFGGYLIQKGSMKVGELTGFLSYVLQILNSLMMISNVFPAPEFWRLSTKRWI